MLLHHKREIGKIGFRDGLQIPGLPYCCKRLKLIAWPGIRIILRDGAHFDLRRKYQKTASFAFTFFHNLREILNRVTPADASLLDLSIRIGARLRPMLPVMLKTLLRQSETEIRVS